MVYDLSHVGTGNQNYFRLQKIEITDDQKSSIAPVCLILNMHSAGTTTVFSSNTDLRKFLLMSVASFLGHGPIAGTAYRTDEAGAQATAQSERTRPLLVANRFHAISQASMTSAKPRNTELASQWLRR